MEKYQVFTPPDYVEKLLDAIGYKDNLMGKLILENSCGDGNILVAIVQRYIDDCRKHDISDGFIRDGLARDIVGIEIDTEQYKNCKKTLDDLINRNDLFPVDWQIFNDDYLRRQDAQKYDYIVGNPPYLTYSEIEESEQVYLKENFISCKKGKFDYCYAFIEKSIGSLSSVGKMSYLIPSSVFRTVFGTGVRDIMLPYLEVILDYTQETIFRKALVKSAIIVLDRSTQRRNFQYIDITTGTDKMIARGQLGSKWIFNNLPTGTKRFGDYFRVSHVVATLLNEAFVLEDGSYEEVKGGYLYKGFFLEKQMVRETATPKNFRLNKKEKIIFPYRYDENHLLIRFIDENDFIKHFPGTYNYLLNYKKKLEKRASDKAAQWFEYGRSQALSSLDCDKYLISTILSSKLQIYKLSKECIPYSGMYIIPRDDNQEISLEEGIEILYQRKFWEYVMNIGIHINGNSVRITSRDIENYYF